MSDRRRRSIETALRRRAGMEPERNQELAGAMERMDDWTGECQLCGVKLRGTMETFRNHECVDGP